MANLSLDYGPVHLIDRAFLSGPSGRMVRLIYIIAILDRAKASHRARFCAIRLVNLPCALSVIC
jgi:hypothetical protein